MPRKDDKVPATLRAIGVLEALVADKGSAEPGKVAGVPTPVIDSVVHLAGALTKGDFFEEG